MQSVDQAWEARKQKFEAACEQKVRTAALQVTKDLNHSIRRLRQYGSEADWAAAVFDACRPFAGRAALFTLRDGIANLRAARGLEFPANLTFPISAAGAFRGVVEMKDSLVVLRTRSEVGEHLASAKAGERAHLVPILNADRIVAILVAPDGNDVDVNALELIAGIASAVLERGSNATLHTKIQPAAANTAQTQRVPGLLNREVGPPSRRLPPWASFPPEERKLHIRAQRFSRVTVAEMQLARPELCRAGREQGNFYLFLKREIDAARETYQKQFMSQPSMVDYLHLELVRVAAGGDEQKLGAEYPGPLV
jgi:hypothetical protein